MFHSSNETCFESASPGPPFLFDIAEKRGYWFDIGKALDALYAKGVQNTDIEELANLSRVDQSTIKACIPND